MEMSCLRIGRYIMNIEDDSAIKKAKKTIDVVIEILMQIGNVR